jgi:hypothetical protein
VNNIFRPSPVFGYTVLQGQELFQPSFFGFPVFFDVFSAFGKGYDSPLGDNNDLQQGICFVPFYSGVLICLKMSIKGGMDCIDHIPFPIYPISALSLLPFTLFYMRSPCRHR